MAMSGSQGRQIIRRTIAFKYRKFLIEEDGLIEEEEKCNPGFITNWKQAEQSLNDVQLVKTPAIYAT